MSNCREIIKLYDSFKRSPVQIARAEKGADDPVNNLILKQIAEKTQEWAITKALTRVAPKAGPRIARAVFSNTAGIVTGLLEPNDSMKGNVGRVYEELRSIIISLEPPADYRAAMKSLPKLRDAIDYVRIEERGNCNCIQTLIDIADDIEKTCREATTQVIRAMP